MNIKHSPDWVCISCYDPSRKHMAKGLCSVCYQKNYRQKLYKTHHRQPAPCRECGALTRSSTELCKRCYMKEYRKTNHNRLYVYKCKNREIKRFGGRRFLIEQRAEGKCERCGITETEEVRRIGKRLVVHHKDGNGFNSDHPNHSLDNLMLLCIPCHRVIHIEIKRRAS